MIYELLAEEEVLMLVGSIVAHKFIFRKTSTSDLPTYCLSTKLDKKQYFLNLTLILTLLFNNIILLPYFFYLSA